MNRILAGCLFAAAVVTASAQNAYGSGGYGPGPLQRPFYARAYAGVSVGQLRYSEQGLDTITPATATVFVGAPLSPYVSMEARLGGGLGSSETNGNDLQVHSMFAGYLKGSLPLAPGFSLYGLGGIASVDLQRNFGLVNTNDTGLSYGLGMDFDLATNARLSLEWTHLATGDNLGYPYDVNQGSISVGWRF